MNYVLLSVFVGGCCDCKNKRGMINTKLPLLLSLFTIKFRKLYPFPSSGVKISQHFWPFAMITFVLTDTTCAVHCWPCLSEGLRQVWTFTPEDYISERICLKARNTLNDFKNNCPVFVLAHTGLLEINRLRTNTLRHYLYCCTVHFEDSLNIIHQKMHQSYIIYIGLKLFTLKQFHCSYMFR
jgi:hypothetical protein